MWIKTLGLGAIAALLCALIAWEVANPPSADAYHGVAANGDGRTQVAPGVGTIGKLPPRAVYDEIVQRPLFRSDRRPYAPPQPQTTAVTAAPDPTLNYLSLTGIVNSPEITMAIFVDRRNNKVLRVEPGANVGGWEISEVGRYTVRLRRNGQERELMLLEPQRPPPRSDRRSEGRTAAPSAGQPRAGREVRA